MKRVLQIAAFTCVFLLLAVTFSGCTSRDSKPETLPGDAKEEEEEERRKEEEGEKEGEPYRGYWERRGYSDRADVKGPGFEDFGIVEVLKKFL